MLKSDLQSEMNLDIIRYSMVWEDADLLKRGLEINNHDNVLIIASGGCNMFELLLQEPASIVAVDLSPAQISLVKTKIQAVKTLSRDDYLSLLGIGEKAPKEVYDDLRPHLGDSERIFWDSNCSSLCEGLLLCGRLDKFFRIFREERLPEIWNTSVAASLAASQSVKEQISLLGSDNLSGLKKLAKEYFGRENFEQHGRDPVQYKYVEQSNTGNEYFKRFKRILSSIPGCKNPYLQFFMTGKFLGSTDLPFFISDESYQKARSLIDKITILNTGMEDILSNDNFESFTKICLSDIFEYVDNDHFHEILRVASKKMKPDSRIAYWNMMVDRQLDQTLVPDIAKLEELSQALSNSDRLWFYKNFNILEKR